LVVEPRSLAQQAVADGSPGLLLYCALIVETVDAQTRAKTGVNERLREWRAAR
jgi:2,3,4,5-tetrahydropyridine-2,6-dicarboxylate N-succinyltransferase